MKIHPLTSKFSYTAGRFLRNAEKYQAKIRTAMIEGKIADEDFNGNPEYNVLGQSGIRPRAPRAPKVKPGEEGEQPEQGKVNPIRYTCRDVFD